MQKLDHWWRPCAVTNYHGQRSDDRSESLKKNSNDIANTLGSVTARSSISFEQRLKNTEDMAEVTKAANVFKNEDSNLYRTWSQTQTQH
jgi:hypothetical protein